MCHFAYVVESATCAVTLLMYLEEHTEQHLLSLASLSMSAWVKPGRWLALH